PVAPRHPGLPGRAVAGRARRRARRDLGPGPAAGLRLSVLPRSRRTPGAMSVGRCTVIAFEHLFDHPDPGRATSTPVRPRAGVPPGVDRDGEMWGSDMRRYDDPVETRMGQVSGVEAPEQFLWRGRLWKVRAV